MNFSKIFISGGGGGGGTLRQSVRTSSANVDDLIHLAGPLTEDAVLKTLQARYYAQEYFVNQFLCINVSNEPSKRSITFGLLAPPTPIG